MCIAIGKSRGDAPPRAPTPRGPALERIPVRFTAQPEAMTPIEIQTLPNAECLVLKNALDLTGPQLFTDDSGIARFFVKPTVASDDFTRWTVRCDAAGQAVSTAVDVRSGATDTVDAPFPTTLRTETTSGRRVPGLVPDEALRLSDEELRARGYPLRPDPIRSPRAYAAWLGAVAEPFEIVDARSVANSFVRHDYRARVQPESVSGGGCSCPPPPPEYDPNWSGYELKLVAGAFGYVTGTWVVPAVTGETSGTTYSSTWVGIDGDGTTDLVQAGTEQDVSAAPMMQAYTYRAWTEFLPQQATEQAAAGLAVNAGDTMYVQVWIGDKGTGPSLSGSYGVFVLMDETTHKSTGDIYTAVGATSVGGSEIEWIMERPCLNYDASTGVCSQYADLANYGTAAMTSAYGTPGPNPTEDDCCGGLGTNITMENGLYATLSSATAMTDATGMTFTWGGFH